jgi:membrane protease YdiL (CAAX protease family)
MSSILFGMEHVGSSSGSADGARQMVFALALGTLLGMLVLVTENLWFAASLHAWINGLLLAATPRLGFGPAGADLPPGASVSLVLIAAFVAAFAMQRRAAPR